MLPLLSNSKLGLSPEKRERLHGSNRQLLDAVCDCVVKEENQLGWKLAVLVALILTSSADPRSTAQKPSISSSVTPALPKWSRLMCTLVALRWFHWMAKKHKGKILLDPNCLKKVSLNSRSVKAGHTPRDKTNGLQSVTAVVTHICSIECQCFGSWSQFDTTKAEWERSQKERHLPLQLFQLPEKAGVPSLEDDDN